MTLAIHRRRPTSRRALLCGLAFGALLHTGPARAEAVQALHIAAGSLDAALTALSAQTHQQLLYRPDLVAGRRAPALDGAFTPEAALARLLLDSGLTATRAGPGVFVLRGAGPPPDPAGAPLASEPQRVPGAPPFGAEGLTAPAADGAAPAVPPRAATTVSEVQVTGSHIRGGHPASPLVVLDRDAIDRSGRATVAEALSVLPQNFAGVATEGTVTTGADKLGRNSAFASSLNLRGLGADATLVLINGRRMAGSGLFGDFADISTIPTAAVRRVEILLDGASALYGSDAVGGVVNIILRRDFEGAETRALLGAATAGEPFQGQLSQTFGRRWSTGNLLVAYEYQQRDALPGADRGFAANADLRPLGGTDQRLTSAFPGNILRTDPVTGGQIPGFAIPAGQRGVGLTATDLQAGVVNLGNQRQGQDILPRQSLNSLYLAANQALGDRVELSADGRFGYRTFSARTAATLSNITVTNANPFFVAPAGATSETVAYSFLGDLPNPRDRGTVESLGLSLGGTVRLGGDWTGEAYVAFAQETERTEITGLINSTALTEAVGSVADRPQTTFNPIRDGFFNPFTGRPGSNSPDVLAYLAEGYSATHGRDAVTSLDLQADGTLLPLPAGGLKLAVGVQARREEFHRGGTNFTASVTPTPQAGADDARQVIAGFVELRAPLFGPDNRRPGLERLELSLAGRVERYDDVGATANPQMGLSWQPVTDVTVRTTYGTSFRAPALREVDDPALNSTALFPLGAARLRGLLLNGGNPGLKPETAQTWTAGVDYAPRQAPGLTLGLTGFDVQFRNRIAQPVAANALNALTDPTLASFVTRIAPATSAADRTLIAGLLAQPASASVVGLFAPEAFGVVVDNRYVNTTALHVTGLDLSGAYGFNLGGDRIALRGSASYMLRYDQQVTPTTGAVDLTGIANFPVRFRGRATADWTRGRLTAGAAFNYVSSYRDSLGLRIADQPTVDLQLRWAPPEQGRWKDIAVAFNVRNLFDRDPPFYNNTAGVGYDPANADPIGRFVSLQLTRSW